MNPRPRDYKSRALPTELRQLTSSKVIIMKAFILWSGGKDSYLAYKKAIQRGFDVVYGLYYVEERSKRLIGCYVRQECIEAQLRLLKVEPVPVYGSKRKGNFKDKLFETVRSLPVEAGILGDIERTEHRNLVESVCSKVGIRTILPLWGMSPEVILEQFFRMGEAIVICRKVKITPTSMLGRKLDKKTVETLRKKGLSITGEDGSYQTFVYHCEEFSLRIKTLKTFRRSYYQCVDFFCG